MKSETGAVRHWRCGEGAAAGFVVLAITSAQDFLVPFGGIEMTLDVLFAKTGAPDAVALATMWATWAGAVASGFAAVATGATAIVALCIASGQRREGRKQAFSDAMAIARVHALAVTQTLRDQAAVLGIVLDETDEKVTSEHVMHIAGVILGDADKDHYAAMFFRRIPPSITLAAEAAPKFPFAGDAIAVIKLHSSLDALARAIEFQNPSLSFSRDRVREVAMRALFQMRETYNRLNDFVRVERK